MAELPRDRAPDSTALLLLEGYDFLPRRFARYGTDVFETRLLGERVTCLQGPDAARLLADPERFARHDAAPDRVPRTLFGEGGVQGLDGPAHAHRKAMLMALVEPEDRRALLDRTAELWRQHAHRWSAEPGVRLLDAVGELLCRGACDWAGVPLREREVAFRTDQLHRLVEAPAAVGPAHWRGRVARRHADEWAAGLVELTRRGEWRPTPNRALDVVAHHHDLHGAPLGARVAGVELLNLLRPVVAVDRYVVFCALALVEHPGWRERLRDGDDDEVWRFVQEVRRTAPFFPFTGARATVDVDWDGITIPAGRLVLLDLYGTNRHPKVWDEPERFDPDRFVARTVDEWSLVPQGGGDHWAHHRCAGEWLTIELMQQACRVLTRDVDYAVPPQDLRVPLRRIPARPNSGLVISEVRPRV